MPPQPQQLSVQEQQQKALNELSTKLLSLGVDFAKRHYVMTGLWLLGLILIQFATGFAVPQSNLQSYESILDTINMKRADDAAFALESAKRDYYNSKGWFSCDANCYRKYDEMLVAEQYLAQVQREDEEVVREAKSKVGVMSEFGVQEVRDLFWGMFAEGKAFGKRSSFYDMIFMSMSAMNRDESLVSFLLRFMMNFLINFTMGMIGAFVGFVYYLWGVVTSYKPDFFSAVVMFLLSTVAAGSILVTYLVALYSAAAGTVFVAVRAAVNMRLADGEQGQPRFIRTNQRSHQHVD